MNVCCHLITISQVEASAESNNLFPMVLNTYGKKKHDVGTYTTRARLIVDLQLYSKEPIVRGNVVNIDCNMSCTCLVLQLFSETPSVIRRRTCAECTWNTDSRIVVIPVVTEDVYEDFTSILKKKYIDDASDNEHRKTCGGQVSVQLELGTVIFIFTGRVIKIIYETLSN